MKKKSEDLFNKTIHEVKKVIADIQNERQEYREETITLRKKHDKNMAKNIKELLDVIDDLHELYLDLSENGD